MCIRDSYKGVELDYSPVASDEEVEEAVNQKLQENAELLRITDRSIKEDDIVCMYYTGYVDGQVNDLCTLSEEEAEEYDLENTRFIDGFKEAIIGTTPGTQIKTEGLAFPETYSSEELAGKPVTIDITAVSYTHLDVYKRQLRG